MALLLAVERVVGAPNEQPAAKFAGINMLVMLGARERTEQEFTELSMLRISRSNAWGVLRWATALIEGTPFRC